MRTAIHALPLLPCRAQVEFQHRLLAFLSAASRSPLSTQYSSGRLVEVLEAQARTAVVGPPTYLSDASSDGWEEELGAYSPSSQLSDWSHLSAAAEGSGEGAEVEGSAAAAAAGPASKGAAAQTDGMAQAQPPQLQAAKQGPAATLSTLLEQQQAAAAAATAALAAALGRPLPSGLAAPQAARRETPYTSSSLSVWLASRASGGQPARVLEPRLCFHEQELVQQVRAAGGRDALTHAFARSFTCVWSRACDKRPLTASSITFTLHVQVIHMLKGVADPGPAFHLDAVRDAYTPRPGVHLHSSSHGSARSLLARFAQAGTAVRRVQAFCAAAVRCAGSVGVAALAEQQEDRRLYSLPTVSAFAAAVAEQQQSLQQQVLVLEAAFNSRALTSLLQLSQRTAGLAQQAAMLAALPRRCCMWRGSAAETAAGLLSGLYDTLQLQLLQARSQGGHVWAAMAWQGGFAPMLSAPCHCCSAFCVLHAAANPHHLLALTNSQVEWPPPCCCASSRPPAARCWQCCMAGCTAASWTTRPGSSLCRPAVRRLGVCCEQRMPCAGCVLNLAVLIVAVAMVFFACCTHWRLSAHHLARHQHPD